MNRFRAQNQKLLCATLASFAKYSDLNPLPDTGGSSIKRTMPMRAVGRCLHCGHFQVSPSKRYWQGEATFHRALTLGAIYERNVLHRQSSSRVLAMRDALDNC